MSGLLVQFGSRSELHLKRDTYLQPKKPKLCNCSTTNWDVCICRELKCWVKRVGQVHKTAGSLPLNHRSFIINFSPFTIQWEMFAKLCKGVSVDTLCSRQREVNIA
ncbi:hypothetical protein GOODEAATRI_000480, partial [Goodea atripinnis]